jgi:hypothetical protein
MKLSHVRGSLQIDPHRARYFPLGLLTPGAGDHVVRRVNLVLRFTRSSRLLNRTSPCRKHSIPRIRLQKLLWKTHATDYFNWRNGCLVNIGLKRTDRNVLPVRRYSVSGTHAEEQHAENLDVVLVTAVIALNTAFAYGAMSHSRSSSDTNLAATMPRPMTDREVRIQQ